jgi:hypothetical protein
MKKLLVPLAALILVVTACDPSSAKGTVQSQGQALTQQYAEKLTTAEPYPLSQMNDSVERKNLRERLLRYNDPNKISYVYLLSQTGSVISFYTIKGKVSSNDSQLTQPDASECHGERCNGAVIRQAPGDDGSYGPNETGVFFFTTENVLVTWSGLYLETDAPLKITSAPTLVYDASNAKPTSTSASK